MQAGGIWQRFSRGVRNAFGHEQPTVAVSRREQLTATDRPRESASVKLQASDALLLEELTALLGSGALQNTPQAPTRALTLRAAAAHELQLCCAAAHEHQLSPTAAAHKQCCIVEGDESLQYDELVAEIEQRVAQLESVLGRYNSSSSLSSKASELRASAPSNPSFSQPASSLLFGVEPYLDEQLADDDGPVSKKVRVSHLLTTRSGEQQVATNNAHIKWASLPHLTLWEILKQLQWERKASGACAKSGRKRMTDGVEPEAESSFAAAVPPPDDDGFTAVNELDMSSACGDPAMSRLVESALGSLSGLRSLNLAHNKVDLLRLTTVGPSLTGLTYLSLALTNTSDALLARMTPFLPSLTDLDLQECTRVTFAPRYQPRLLASLTSLTRLNLGCTKVDDEGMQALAPLTALTHLSLFGTHVSAEGLDLLAPFAAHLTHLVLGGVRGEEGDIYGDPEMIAVSSLTALTHLEMRYSGGGDFVSEEG
eukprot:CAMPEP_0198215314 /NCGR_PEP_ID=MMETSP1445-20131203/48865_1 /TAXON_ID=36898 /ORGANISM="Pyramimonas sp., Strain CCMP2087" /LENGTH=482 /DNA_ID=CAMNT_0043890983 /DNA_START=141 /DNA_END=1587 /DNA_ORIENTATION=-